MLCNSLSPSSLHCLIPVTCKPPLPPPRIGVERILQVGSGKTTRRGISVVTRAAPTATTYIFAFVFPLSLLAITIFTSVRIADKLDQKFLEEVRTILTLFNCSYCALLSSSFSFPVFYYVDGWVFFLPIRNFD